ncbi:mRNA export factor-like isoform X2 [Schistocerca gregaria]|uniref:mRNA export factor-like isoform X2 n=1 Tax=Schistocerca gregaria TaxID=7010 RepID=UPI00211DD816|nr:mRNA export factor-like isoform X2 [Schistocerca gregaria]
MESCWQVNQNGTSELKGSMQHEAPALGLSWNSDGTKVFSAGCDCKGMMWDIATGTFTQVAKHDEPINICRVVMTSRGSLVCTGSWDRTLKYWDTRQQQPIVTCQLKDRPYCADFLNNLAVVCTVGNTAQVYNLNDPLQVFKSVQSSLRYQVRCISCFPDSTGFAMGSIEGRVALHYIDGSTDAQGKSKDFNFKCHRLNDVVYGINTVLFNKQYGTLLTGGSDGFIYFWDKQSRSRIKEFKKLPSPITASALNFNESILAYAEGYDWYMGAEYNNPSTYPICIFIRAIGTEMKGKQ